MYIRVVSLCFFFTFSYALGENYKNTYSVNVSKVVCLQQLLRSTFGIIMTFLGKIKIINK